MPQEPPVLARLKALGLSLRTIATYMGASPSAVSAWYRGKNPLGEPWLTEATFLLAVVSEHLTHGGTLANFTYRPTMVMNPGGITQMSDPLDIPDECLEDFVKMRTASQGVPPAHIPRMQGLWFAKLLAARLVKLLDLDPLTAQPTARDLETIHRTAASLRLCVRMALPPAAPAAFEETRDADETA